jgi:hypothetical protein
VYSGDVLGCVNVWDVRMTGGGRGMGSLSGSRRCGVMASFGLKAALAAVPTLAEATDVAAAAAAVDSLVLDPKDGSRLAFHLRGGWSGVLRIGGPSDATAVVTHAFCPAQVPVQVRRGRAPQRGSPPLTCWWTRILRVDGTIHMALDLYDLAPSRH